MREVAELSELRSINVPKAAQLVANSLRTRIARGELRDGDPLPNEAALTEMFQVSRPTLREALRILEHEGLIAVKRGAHGGARVQAPGVEPASRYAAMLLQVRNTTLEDLFAARRIIEPAAVRMLAEKPTRASLKRLREQLRVEEQLLEQPERYAEAATDFHELLVRLSGNQTLTLFSEMLIEIVGRHHKATFIGAPSKRKEFAEVGSQHHSHLIDLIDDGRAVEAEAFWRFHIEGAASRAMQHLGHKTIVELLT